MKFRTDFGFHIGEQHLKNGKPCQDYAHAGMLTDTSAFAIVSDGCSSGGRTDIGARLMVLATEHALREQFSFMEDTAIAVKAARDAYLRSWCDSLRLCEQDLYATGLAIVATEAGYGMLVAGDGVIAVKYGERIVVQKCEWQKNTPFYPAYNLFPGRRAAFVDLHGHADEALTAEMWDITETDACVISRKSYSAVGGSNEMYYTTPYEGSPEFLAVMSDGVFQVDGVDWKDVVRELLAYKSVSGQFVVRRMNRFLSTVRQNGRGTLDDIACAVIHLDHEQK